MDVLMNPMFWAAFGTLTVLETILGVDNVIFISIAASRLPPHQRRTARLIGMTSAMVVRILMLLALAMLMQAPGVLFTVAGHPVTWGSLVMLIGGLFLMYKSATEIFQELEGTQSEGRAAASTMAGVITQIILLDMVFSLDSVVTAVAIGQHIAVMIAAIVVSSIIMMLASDPIARFIESHPSTKMLALAFLVMIGMTLFASGLGHEIQRGFIYAAMLFSCTVEALNLLRADRRARAAEDALPDGALARVPVPGVPLPDETIRIRPETPADIAAIHDLTDAAFAEVPYSEGTEPWILHALRREGDLSLSLLAEDDSGVLGHLAFSPLHISGPAGSVSGWYGLGPVSVRADRRRQGLARALVATGLATLRARGARGVALVGNPDVYGPMGFVSTGQLGYGDLDRAYIQQIAFDGSTPTGQLTFAPGFDASLPRDPAEDSAGDAPQGASST